MQDKTLIYIAEYAIFQHHLTASLTQPQNMFKMQSSGNKDQKLLHQPVNYI